MTEETTIDDKVINILLPVYNNKEDVLNAIQSVVKQTYTKWKLIVIDDCSTDGSYEVVKQFIEDNPQYDILHIRNDVNRGLFISLNIGLTNATGDYICRIDSDDTIVADYFEFNVLSFKDNPNAKVIKTCGKRGRTTLREITVCYKTDIVKEIGYYDSVRFGADSEFMERISASYKKVGTIMHFDKICYYAKTRQGSLTTSPKTSDWGIRSAYMNLYKKWHRENNGKLYMPFPLLDRLFPVPNDIMLP